MVAGIPSTAILQWPVQSRWPPSRRLWLRIIFHIRSHTKIGENDTAQILLLASDAILCVTWQIYKSNRNLSYQTTQMNVPIVANGAGPSTSIVLETKKIFFKFSFRIQWFHITVDGKRFIYVLKYYKKLLGASSIKSNLLYIQLRGIHALCDGNFVRCDYIFMMVQNCF